SNYYDRYDRSYDRDDRRYYDVDRLYYRGGNYRHDNGLHRGWYKHS
ncbi:hypothetical protein ACG91C_21065, partial [Acinetobacter baumannii]